jgi:hypothetical protein
VYWTLQQQHRNAPHARRNCRLARVSGKRQRVSTPCRARPRARCRCRCRHSTVVGGLEKPPSPLARWPQPCRQSEPTGEDSRRGLASYHTRDDSTETYTSPHRDTTTGSSSTTGPNNPMSLLLSESGTAELACHSITRSSVTKDSGQGCRPCHSFNSSPQILGEAESDLNVYTSFS